MSENTPPNLPESQGQNDQFFRDFLHLQQQEVALRFEEAEIRKQEIEANKQIALASITAQENTDKKRGDVFLNIHKWRTWLLFACILAVSGILFAAMKYDRTEIALKIIEIGGAVLLGYFAGLYRGKAQAMENRDKNEAD